MMGITSVWICNGQITRTFTTEDSVLIARYPRSVSISKYMTLKFPDSNKSLGIGNLRLKLGNWEL